LAPRWSEPRQSEGQSHEAYTHPGRGRSGDGSKRISAHASCADPRPVISGSIHQSPPIVVAGAGLAPDMRHNRRRGGTLIVGTWLVTYIVEGKSVRTSLHSVAQRRHRMGKHQLAALRRQHLRGLMEADRCKNMCPQSLGLLYTNSDLSDISTKPRRTR